MTLDEIFQDKAIKAKGKVAAIGEWLLNSELPVDELLAYAEKQKATNKATCIEAVEYATKKNPTLADEYLLNYVTKALKDEEPRVKWESAKVIGNIAKLFPAQLEKPIDNLLPNAENTGTVVRWATAYALAEILKLKTDSNKKLLPKIESLCEKEEDNGVKKKYLDALKKVKK
ncbi:HEAT repeat domain-containing protein [Sphingobacterium sp. SGG-5]|uniref:HEAT repeat domain-containing protein n=1 Tax=Sphingobacterium sp. SGG-5 TaxID=2710881 RepID=UPI0013EDC837|nr:HEAT repeat domain-containing protein [Sphingobacterium sp. SGG-5]NGM61382.1 HEAT repeat domain-containing protein [Sphingobacterium sp. SGG-5]